MNLLKRRFFIVKLKFQKLYNLRFHELILYASQTYHPKYPSEKEIHHSLSLMVVSINQSPRNQQNRTDYEQQVEDVTFGCHFG